MRPKLSSPFKTIDDPFLLKNSNEYIVWRRKYSKQKGTSHLDSVGSFIRTCNAFKLLPHIYLFLKIYPRICFIFLWLFYYEFCCFFGAVLEKEPVFYAKLVFQKKYVFNEFSLCWVAGFWNGKQEIYRPGKVLNVVVD